jgi:hypothetical protein
LIKQNPQQFFVDVIRRHGRGNDGLTSHEAIDVVCTKSHHISLRRKFRILYGKPSDQIFTGPALFDHLVGFARTHTSAHIKLTPSSYLNVEMTMDQHIILHPSRGLDPRAYNSRCAR